VEVVLGQVLTRDHGQHARHGERLRRVDLLDVRVGERAPDDVEIQHARKLDVVDIGALAADEAWVLLPLDRMPHASDFW